MIFLLAFKNPAVSAVNSRSSRLLHARLFTAAGTGTPWVEPTPAPSEAAVAASVLLKNSATHRHSEEGAIFPVVRLHRLLSARFIAAASPPPPQTPPPPPFTATAVVFG